MLLRPCCQLLLKPTFRLMCGMLGKQRALVEVQHLSSRCSRPEHSRDAKV
jgi:hypothetical protein